MKFICQQSALNEAINNVAGAVPQKSPISSLEGIKLFINYNQLEITGYDLELGIQTTIPIESDDYGEYIFNCRLFSEIVRKMPNEKIIFEIDDKMTTTITCASVEYKIIALSADDYPSIPFSNKDNSFALPQPILKNMIGQTVFAVATNDNKPVLMGELFDIENGNFNLVAIDGFRLAVRSEEVANGGRFYFVVKAKALNEISKLMKDDMSKLVTVYVSKKHVTFEINGYMVISRLLEGDFHNYKGSLPTSHSTEIIINTKNLINSLERCLLLINDKIKAPVRCKFDNGKLQINCSTSLGKFFDEFEIDLSGSPIEIGFNCRYLLDAVKATESDRVRLQLSNPLAPMKILPLKGEAYTFLVLPVRLKG